MNVDVNRFNYFLHKIADPQFNVLVQKDNLILTKNKLAQVSPLEERVEWVVNYISSQSIPLNQNQLKLVQSIKHNLSTAVNSQDQEIQKILKSYLEQLDHLDEPRDFKPVAVSLQVAPPPSNKEEFESNLKLMLANFPRYQLHPDLSVYDTIYQSIPNDWNVDLMLDHLHLAFQKYEEEEASDLTALKAEILNLLKIPHPIQMGIIIETCKANTENPTMLADYSNLLAKGLPCVVNRHFFQAQARNLQLNKKNLHSNSDIYIQKHGDLCVVIPKGKSLAELGFNPELLTLSAGEHLKPSQHPLRPSVDLPKLLINETQKHRFCRLISFSGHGLYPGYPNGLNNQPAGEIAGLGIDEFQKTLDVLRDKNMVFMFLRSCYSGGTNIENLHLTDQSLPCPIYVESAFDITVKVRVKMMGEEEYNTTKVLEKAQQMLLPEDGQYGFSPLQLKPSDKEHLAKVMNYSDPTAKFSNLGTLLLPTRSHHVPKVAYALTDPAEILDISQTHRKNLASLQPKEALEPLVDNHQNRKGYLLSDPIVPFSLVSTGSLPMILLSRGGSTQHVIKEITASKQDIEEIAKATFNAFQALGNKDYSEPAAKVFLIGSLKCLYGGQEMCLKRVIIKNTMHEREVLFQVEGQQDFRRLKFKKNIFSSYPWEKEIDESVNFKKALKEIYQAAVTSAPSSKEWSECIEAMNPLFFGEQMPESAIIFSAIAKNSAARLKLALRNLNEPREAMLEILRDAVDIAKYSNSPNLVHHINEASYTPLMAAVQQGDHAKAKTILQDSPETLNMVNAQGTTALIVALNCKQFEIAKWLIAKSSIIDVATPKFFEAATPDFLEWYFLTYGLHESDEAGKQLSKVLARKNWKLVDNLINKLFGEGADPLNTPCLAKAFMAAVDKELLQHLLDYPGIDIKLLNHSPINLLKACIKKQEIEGLKFLLAHGSDPNLQDLFKDAPLHFVAAEKDKSVELAKTLLEAGARINIQDGGKNTPLHLAIKNQNKPLIEFLIRRGASLDIKNYKANPLELAAEIPGLLEFILQIPGIDINPRTCNLPPLFEQAIMKGNLKLASLMLQHGVQIDKVFVNREPLLLHFLRHMPSEADPVNVVQFFLDHGADLSHRDDKGHTVMHWVMQNHHVPIFNCLKDAKISFQKPVNQQGLTPFMVGLLGSEMDESTRKVIRSYVEQFPECIHQVNPNQMPIPISKDLPTLKTLLKKAGQINTKPLFESCDLELIKMLDAQGVDFTGETGIHYLKKFLGKYYTRPDQRDGVIFLLSKIKQSPHAALSCAISEKTNEEFIDLLLNHPSMNLQETDPSLGSPLCCAIFYQNIAAATKLIARKAIYQPPEKEAAQLKNPLQLLVLSNEHETDAMLEICKLLVEAGYDHVNEISASTTTPFYYAILLNHKRMISYFLEHGADLSIVYDKDRTALHAALIAGRIQLAELLINKGIDVNKEDQMGNTGLHYALKLAAGIKEDQLTPLIKLLTSKGAKWDNPNRDGVTAKELAIKMRLGHALQLFN